MQKGAILGGVKNMTTQQEMPTKLIQRLPFKGNSVFAVKDNQGLYRVYSYDTLIYQDADTGAIEDLMFDNTFYSRTTSKLQNMLIDVLGLDWSETLRKKKRDDNVYPVAYTEYARYLSSYNGGTLKD